MCCKGFGTAFTSTQSSTRRAAIGSRIEMTTRRFEPAKTQDIKPFFLDLSEPKTDDIAKVFRNILTSGQLILGPYTKKFEAEFARYTGKRHGVALNTGTSALEVLLMANGAAGKKVAVQSNTNFAS